MKTFFEEKNLVGNFDIDSDHKELSDLINHLYVTIFFIKIPKVINLSFIKLMNFIMQTMNKEELIMLSTNFSEIEIHRQEHMKILMYLLQQKHLINNGNYITEEFFVKLKDWLDNHSLNHDFELSIHLRQKGERLWKGTMK